MSIPSLPKPDQNIIGSKKQIIASLRKLVPQAVCIEDEDSLETYASDAFSGYRQKPLAVILPNTTEEISAVMGFCHEQKIKVMARGAGTSLSGAALPEADALVICLSKMKQILELDFTNRTATVQAGLTNQGLNDAIASENFFFAPDPMSRLACSIGGNIAMNAGGPRAIKYGATTNNILGLKMVMMNGKVIELGGKYLDATSYDFLGLITGSEGQLGIVSEATLKIIRAPEGVRPTLIAFDSVRNASDCVASIISHGMQPSAIEIMHQQAIQICDAYKECSYPNDAQMILIVEFEGSDAEIDMQFEFLRDISRAFAPSMFREAQTAQEAEQIWSGYKTFYGAAGYYSDYYCTDGVIPLNKLTETIAFTQQVGKKYNLTISSIFHAADGTLQSLILYDANQPDILEKVKECADEILVHCVESGGSLTGENGIGIRSKNLMPIQFTEHDLIQQIEIKNIFDPDWLLNASKVFPLPNNNIPSVSETTSDTHTEEDTFENQGL